MISTNELMLGNWVEYATGREEKPTITALVTTIFSGTVFLDGCLDVEAEGLLGIPVTEELLEKCGFNSGHDHIWKVGDTILFQNRDDFDLNFDGQSISGILYLHELQNAYFMLTRKHLEVNL